MNELFSLDALASLVILNITFITYFLYSAAEGLILFQAFLARGLSVGGANRGRGLIKF